MNSMFKSALFVLALICQVSSLRFSLDDDSPYCKELNDISDMCRHTAARFICTKTCNSPQPAFQPCGVPRIENSLELINKRIVGGKRSAYGDWPWQVALMLHGRQVCGGAVLTSEWIVTAAHCFGFYSSSDPKDWSVLAGEHHLKEKESFEQFAYVEKIVIHKKNFRYWKLGYDIPDDYDIALLKIDRKLKFTPFVQPVCLPRKQVTFRPGKRCKVAGWGHTAWNGSQPDILREATVRLVPKKACNRPWAYNGTIHGRAICAGYRDGGVDACQYDSGGGLVCDYHGQYFLQGIVSWGYECARPHKYGAYTNVPLLNNWIINKILNYNALQ